MLQKCGFKAKLAIANLEREIKLKHKSFSMEKDGFVGHLAETDENSDTAVIVIMGGEKAFYQQLKLPSVSLNMELLV